MRHLLFLLPIFFAAGTVSGQRVIDITNGDVDAANITRQYGLAGGTIFPPNKYVKVKEGSPYFWDEWTNGSLVSESGTTYQNLELKLDLLNHEIHYKDETGREMIVSSPVRELIFRPGSLDKRIFIPGKPWSSVDKKLADAWLLVLVNDKVSLLLDTRKKMTETNGYASSTAEQTIEDKEVYFIQKKGELIRVDHWSDLLDIFNDKRKEMAKYMKENDLTGDAPLEYAQAVTYYNSL